MQSAKSLKTWQQALARGDVLLRVVSGTKGGRPRNTTVARCNELVHGLNAAVAYSVAHGSKLVDKLGLRSAIAT
ncbi:integrase domain-containing protein [Citrobacter sp. MGH105]|uniref:integrase domain-containing protein n=1 Tax=Citrobacter sp. MGH105 TaxID=1686380 RepID=UPI00069F4944|nr:integrase domain-containing protein [Citrobacter sp. MGH105]